MRALLHKYFLTNTLSRQIFLFLLVGGFCYFISLLLLVVLVEVLQQEVNLANLIASLIAIYIAYLLNRKYIFESGKLTAGKELSAFYFFSFIGLLMNVVLMYWMTSYLPISYLISKTLVTIVVAVFNFLTRKLIVFNG